MKLAFSTVLLATIALPVSAQYRFRAPEGSTEPVKGVEAPPPAAPGGKLGQPLGPLNKAPVPTAVLTTSPKADKKKAKRAPPPPVSPMVTHNGDKWANEFWGFELTLPGFPGPGQVPPGSDPTQTFFATDASLHPEGHVNVAVTVEEADAVQLSSDCAQRRLIGDILQHNPRDLVGQDSPFPYRTFDEDASPAQMEAMGLHPGAQAIPRIRQGYAYFTRGTTCFELHMTDARMPWQALKPEVLPKMAAIANSFKLRPVALGGLDTLALIAEMGGNPMDPDIYAKLGDAAWKQMQDPVKAERYYRSELVLGARGPAKAWLARFVVGKADVSLGRSEEARASLEEALRLAEDAGLGKKKLRDTAFELAAAEALAGRPAESKSRLSALFKEAGSARPYLSRLESEPAFASVRADAAFPAWLKSLKPPEKKKPAPKQKAGKAALKIAR